MANTTTTQGKEFDIPTQEVITLYHRDGSVWTGAPIDAREALATGEYSLEKPEGKPEGTDVQPPNTETSPTAAPKASVSKIENKTTEPKPVK